MFGKHHTLTRLASGIALAVCLAVVAVPSAFATTSAPFITDTLGGNGSARALPDVIDRYVAQHAEAQGTAFITDTMGGNGHPAQPTGSYPNYVNAGMSPLAHSASTSTGFSWNAALIGAGLASGVLLLLLGGTRLRTNRRGALTV